MPVTSYDLFVQADGAGFATQTTPFSNLVKVTYEKPFLKSLDQDTFIFTLFPRKSTDDEYVRWKIKTSGNAGTEFYEEEDPYNTGIGPTGAIASTSQQNYVNAEVKIKLARILVSFSNLAVAAKGSSWVDIRADEIEGSLRDFRSALNDAFLRTAFGADTRRSDSLGSIIGDGDTSDGVGVTGVNGTGNPYATINRGGGPTFWDSYVDATATARPLTIAQMQTAWARLQRPARSANISHILTSPGLTDAYGDLADSRRRWTISNESGSGRSGKIDLGYSGLAYKGVPIVSVQRFPDVSAGVSSRMYFIDSSVWNVYTLKAFDTSEVPVTTDITTLCIKTYLQLVCKAPYKQGLISDLASTY